MCTIHIVYIECDIKYACNFSKNFFASKCAGIVIPYKCGLFSFMCVLSPVWIHSGKRVEERTNLQQFAPLFDINNREQSTSEESEIERGDRVLVFIKNIWIIPLVTVNIVGFSHCLLLFLNLFQPYSAVSFACFCKRQRGADGGRAKTSSEKNWKKYICKAMCVSLAWSCCFFSVALPYNERW